MQLSQSGHRLKTVSEMVVHAAVIHKSSQYN